MSTEPKYDHRLYRCTVCGNQTTIGTNHTGPCMSHCKSCSWKSTGFGPGVRINGTIHRNHVCIEGLN